MKRIFKIGLVLVLLSTAGCQTLRDLRDRVDDWANVPPVEDTQPEPEPEPTPQPPTQSIEGNQRFLWKPVSESRQGRAAVLLPARIARATIRVNGAGPAETRGRTNGNRLTFFLGRTGSAYGSNVTVEAVHNGEVLATWKIPRGSRRFER